MQLLPSRPRPARTSASPTPTSRSPIRYNGFIEDRLDLGDVVIVGGLRYDYYDSRASRTQVLTGLGLPSSRRILPPTDPGRPLDAGQEPQLPEPARPGVVPGDRADQLPAVLRPPGAGAGLRAGPAAASTPTCSMTNTNHAVRHRPRLRPRPSPSSSASGTRSATTWCSTSRPTTRTSCRTRPARIVQVLRSDAAARNQEIRGIYQRRLRQHPRHRRAARPALRRPVQRQPGLHLPGRQEHRHRSVLPTSSFSSRDPATRLSGGNSPPPQAILPTNDSRPHNLAGSAALTFPDDWKQGSRGRRDAAERGPVRHLPAGQRHRLHPLPVGRHQSRFNTEHRLWPNLLRQGRAGRQRSERRPAADVQAVRPAGHQVVRLRRHSTSRCTPTSGTCSTSGTSLQVYHRDRRRREPGAVQTGRFVNDIDRHGAGGRTPTGVRCGDGTIDLTGRRRGRPRARRWIDDRRIGRPAELLRHAAGPSSASATATAATPRREQRRASRRLLQPEQRAAQLHRRPAPGPTGRRDQLLA